jgi:uncharacterized Zn-finger protein
MHICKDLGIEVVQKRITRDEIYIADEAFFTGTAAEVTPIRELDRVEIGAGSPRPRHREDPERLLRHRQRPQSQVRPLAHQGLNHEHTTAKSVVELLAKDLNANGGVFCPSPKADMKLWNSHPQVYLDVAAPARPSARTAARSTS